MNALSDAKPVPSGRARRIVQVGKWAGLIACVLIGAFMGVSVRRTVAWTVYGPEFGHRFTVRGASLVHWTQPAGPTDRVGFRWFGLLHISSRFNWRFEQQSADGTTRAVVLPLWAPLGPVVLSTAAAWSIDRRLITRLRAGLCPECR